MPAWLFSSPSDPRRPLAGRPILQNLRLSLVPVDGDFGRVRRPADRVPGSVAGAAGPESGEERGSSSAADTAARPALPTHARNAVEEWIPSAVLYGPPR